MACLELGDATPTRISQNDKTVTKHVKDSVSAYAFHFSSRMWLYLFAVFVVWKATSWLWMRWNYDLHKIPSPPSVPFLGHALRFIKVTKENIPMYEHFNKWRQDLGAPKIMRVHLFFAR